MADLAALQQKLGINLNNPPLLEQALVHSSYVNENPGLTSNERLEFLGDAVLGLIIAQKLYQDFPNLTEGEMTKLRASLVRRETLAHLAEVIGLGDQLYLGKGEEASGGRQKPANLASALEAVIAAIFLDQDIDTTQDFILTLFSAEIEKVIGHGPEIDYKSALQELLQAREQQAPIYEVIQVTGPEHSRIFTVEVKMNKRVLGKGSGKSKKAAESEAARNALDKLPASFT